MWKYIAYDIFRGTIPEFIRRDSGTLLAVTVMLAIFRAGMRTRTSRTQSGSANTVKSGSI